MVGQSVVHRLLTVLDETRLQTRRVLGPPATLIACAFVLLPAVLGAAAPDSSTYDGAVVRVISASAGGEIVGTGSGFFVDELHVVTNQHVVSGEGMAAAPMISIVLAGGRDWLPASVRWEDEGIDLAVLRTSPGRGRSSVALNLGGLTRGMDVYAVGYPGSADRASGDLLQSTLTDGILSKPPFEARWGAQGSGTVSMLQHTAAISPGSSGGPLLDDCGSVLGVNTGGGVTEIHDAAGNIIGATSAQGIFLALHASELSRALDRWSVDYRVAGACSSSGTSAAGHPATTGAAWIVAFVVAILGAALFLGLRRRRFPAARPMAGSHDGVQDGTPDTPPGEAPVSLDPALAGNTLRLTGMGDAPHLALDLQELRSAVHGLSFGRQSDLVDSPLAVEGLSRRHFRVRLDQGRTFVEDLNSTNGTFVNGQRLTPYRGRQLRAGDELAAGAGRWNVAKLA